MFDPPSVEEVLASCRGEDTGTIGGNVLGHPPAGEVLSQGGDHVGRVISLQAQD